MYNDGVRLPPEVTYLVPLGGVPDAREIEQELREAFEATGETPGARNMSGYYRRYTEIIHVIGGGAQSGDRIVVAAWVHRPANGCAGFGTIGSYIKAATL